MRPSHWRRRNEALDPAVDFVEMYRTVVSYEFPWDMNQALSFALFRTYAVPGIGRLLDETGEFGTRAQKRYDDTALLLEVPTVKGFDDPEARAAIRRVNQMHRRYDIPDHEFRYVLSTFVVVPKRWLDDYGKRPLSAAEVEASVHYYRMLGGHMGIRDIPETFAGFAELMDAYEAEHFAFDEGARRVADATLALLVGFHPRLPAKAVEAFSRALMDDPLLDAFRYEKPSRSTVALARTALKLHGFVGRFLPSRTTPVRIVDLPWVRSYPDGYDVEQMGTFVGGCPVPHGERTDAAAEADQATG
ncbi:hypothetical protein JOD63_000273 [Microbacterium terrae]|uniref:ER-bound oxygenase mpaB/mpaB'/Rubber oxygenase catalytic domain-containing protein n=1 Tax=Microbacterium terrae TaxID=69369 RepID=A0A0M2GUW8_9MICO|nr:oxygenase MpaB family protein [Microbacterium terrae]KJL37476.1 hypothetical protein RS81_03230 [Microbacterium terrae]MBP1076305.1 hypothetical protein [Microbacterium terrae]GLJ97127.1 peptidase [Microbacterium terrae]